MPLTTDFRPPPEPPEPISQKAWNDARAPIARLLRWAISNAVATAEIVNDLRGGGSSGGGSSTSTTVNDIHVFLVMGG